jgi:hypothetical protein
MLRRRAGVVIAIVAVFIGVSAGSASAGRIDPPGHSDGNHCVNAFGIDLNDLYGISDQFRVFECRELSAGEHWVRPVWWFTNFGADAVYPAGYVPARPEPIDDFVSKLATVKVVIDSGTPRERTYLFDGSAITRTDIDVEEVAPGAAGAPYPQASILPRLKPLNVGDHFVEIFLILTAQHCDGFSTDAELNCLPAGPSQFVGHPVSVTKPAH